MFDINSDIVYKAKEYVKKELSVLSDNFFYHNIAHTLDVFDKVTYL
jgi:hypothetical protein